MIPPFLNICICHANGWLANTLAEDSAARSSPMVGVKNELVSVAWQRHTKLWPPSKHATPMQSTTKILVRHVKAANQTSP